MAKDPYKYYRIEARELLEGLTQGAIDLEKRGISKEVVNRLLRLAHTLKGAARVVKQREVSEFAHGIEELLSPFRDAAGEFPSDQVTGLLKLIDGCSEHLKPVFSAPELERISDPPQKPAGEPEEGLTSVRVEIAEMDSLLYDLADAANHLGVLYRDLASLNSSLESANSLAAKLASSSGPKDTGNRLRDGNDSHLLAEELSANLRRSLLSLQTGIDRAHSDISAIRDKAEDLRLLPARTIFALLERTVRDAAEVLQKQVTFEAAGGENRLDAHVLLALRDALAHVVRNAVTHGIESASKRFEAGKAQKGRVQLKVSRKGQRIHFTVEDDGGGVNLAAIQDSLIAKGVISPSAARALGIPEATKLLLQGGLSTAAEVSEVMGRGIGLDVVRETIGRLKGEVHLRTQPGRGTSVELMVPVSIESLEALAVDAGVFRVLIPFEAVHQTGRMSKKDLVRSAGGVALILEGQAIPFAPLDEILSRKSQPGHWPSVWTIIVVRTKDMQAAVGVNRLIGVRNVVVRPLPTLCGPIPLVSGATLDGEGNPELVLDPSVLIGSVHSSTGQVAELEAAKPLSVMVVDDSLTSRMLEQSILETAGYQVDVAISGEDALEKAKQKKYALFVVDVEMPGMDGFELLERFQADPVLKTIPAILVTSRTAAEDRRRGEQAGARDHIAKGAFEEGHLLRTIRRILAEESP